MPTREMVHNIVVTAPIDAVWRLISDLPTITAVLSTGAVITVDPPDGRDVGITFTVQRPGAPLSSYRITRWAPPSEIEYAITIAGSPDATGRIQLTQDGQGTAIRSVSRFELVGLGQRFSFALFQPLLKRRARRVDEDLRRHIEANA